TAKADQRGTVTGNILNPATPYTDQQAAEFAAGILANSEQPGDALERMLRQVADHPAFGRIAQRAAKAAVIILQRGESPSPLDVAESWASPRTNGRPPAA
ncbi:MAG TPA: hypothetical protein VKA46_39400, partial [Gemmataceae bacterium]|nr:hypothetical protein [Gemmataceae bacterium]